MNTGARSATRCEMPTDTIKPIVGELLGIKIMTTCPRCKQDFQINKQKGDIDYTCPKCKVWVGRYKRAD